MNNIARISDIRGLVTQNGGIISVSNVEQYKNDFNNEGDIF